MHAAGSQNVYRLASYTLANVVPQHVSLDSPCDVCEQDGPLRIALRDSVSSLPALPSTASATPFLLSVASCAIAVLFYLGLVPASRRQEYRYPFSILPLPLPVKANITPRILAMGFPSEGTEGLFRNPMAEVQAFFKQFHDHKYKIYNLCAERCYDASRFDGSVEHFPFEDHQAAPVSLIYKFCQSVEEWLSRHPENVVAVHCKAGKGRTGLMICAYLLYLGLVDTPLASLKLYGEARTTNGKGVTIPSQRRYLSYFSKALNEGPPPVTEARLTSMTIRNLGVRNDIHVVLWESEGDGTHKLHPVVSSCHLGPRQDAISISRELGMMRVTFEDVFVRGDVKVQVFEKKVAKENSLFYFWFNPSYVEGHSLVLCERQLDKMKFKTPAGAPGSPGSPDKSVEVEVMLADIHPVGEGVYEGDVVWAPRFPEKANLTPEQQHERFQLQGFPRSQRSGQASWWADDSFSGCQPLSRVHRGAVLGNSLSFDASDAGWAERSPQPIGTPEMWGHYRRTLSGNNPGAASPAGPPHAVGNLASPFPPGRENGNGWSPKDGYFTPSSAHGGYATPSAGGSRRGAGGGGKGGGDADAAAVLAAHYDSNDEATSSEDESGSQGAPGSARQPASAHRPARTPTGCGASDVDSSAAETPPPRLWGNGITGNGFDRLFPTSGSSTPSRHGPETPAGTPSDPGATMGWMGGFLARKYSTPGGVTPAASASSNAEARAPGGTHETAGGPETPAGGSSKPQPHHGLHHTAHGHLETSLSPPMSPSKVVLQSLWKRAGSAVKRAGGDSAGGPRLPHFCGPQLD
eukprot:jgi/Mesvir1/1444/Mv14435-RA.1